MAKIPPFLSESEVHRILVICEGDEEFKYFNRLIELNVWCNSYVFKPLNVKSASNIPARYQDAYQNNRSEMILVFCDTDKAPFREYSKIKSKINAFLGKRNAADKIIIFANPCSMQIILSHFGDVSLKNQGKKTNADVIEKLTEVKDYDAHEDQIAAICDKIYRRTYPNMKQRVAAINFPDTTSCSTNFILFLDHFEDDNAKWITIIQKQLSEQE